MNIGCQALSRSNSKGLPSAGHCCGRYRRHPAVLVRRHGWSPTVSLPLSSASPCQRPSLACSSASTSGSTANLLVMELARQWLQWDRNPATRAHIEHLVSKQDWSQISALLGSRLEFGTAGLRGLMGAGYARMNALVIQQTSQGLCACLELQAPDTLRTAGVVIGYDGRHGSREFAEITARVMASRGARVHLFSDLVPTPLVAAGVALLGAAAGVMVTASHNPKEYNGYKVYWGNGCQIIPPHDAEIAAAIESHLEPWPLPDSQADVYTLPGMSDPTELVTHQYYQRLVQGVHYNSPALNAAAQPVVYTPLHGVGAPFVLRAFKEFGLPAPHIVPAQASPDPEFPTVVFPNPEEGKGTWALAFAEGEKQGARLVMANDPDADRLSVAERNTSVPGGWQVFNGNQIGIMLAHWVWTNFKQRSPQVAGKSSCAMLASTVSSRMLAAMAAKEGFRFVETLTGFKWLGNTALALEAGSPAHVLFAFEEAIGFMLGAMFKDKDGVAAAAAFAELAASVYAQGSSLGALLESLYDTYGYHDYRAGYFVTDASKSRAVFDELRRDGHYAQSVAGVKVVAVRDLGTGLDTSQADGKAVLPWQAGDMMITYTFQGNATLTLRASGTEPKLKYYLEAAGQDRAAASALAAKLQAAVAEELVGVSRNGLSLPPSA